MFDNCKWKQNLLVTINTPERLVDNVVRVLEKDTGAIFTLRGSSKEGKSQIYKTHMKKNDILNRHHAKLKLTTQ